jgi:phosphatidylglycerol:prolipoprotein diacylglycerol transferase
MRPTLFRIPLPLIGSLPVHGYGLMVAFGFLVAIYVAARRARKRGVPSQAIFDLGLYVLVSALVGARILHFLQHRSSYSSFVDVFKIYEGGLAYYGGFILAFVVAVLYLRSRKLSIARVADVIAPSLMLGLGIGRIGCFLAGCCFGKPTSLPWGITFPERSLAWIEIGAQKVHPTQLYSFISLMAIFTILIVLQKYMKFPGQLFLTCVLIYSVHRFLIDFVRYYTPDERIGSLAASQVMSIVAGAAALVVMIVFIARHSSHAGPAETRKQGEKKDNESG